MKQSLSANGDNIRNGMKLCGVLVLCLAGCAKTTDAPQAPVEEEKAKKPSAKVVLPGAEWGEAHWTQAPVEPDSVLDLTDHVPAPAGALGRVLIRNGHFEFENRPGEQAYFRGCNLSRNVPTNCTKEFAEVLATRLAAMGYNAVRFQHADQNLAVAGDDRITDEKKLDGMFYLIDQLKKHGIYFHMDVWSHRCLFEADTKIPLQEFFSTVCCRLGIDQAYRDNVKSFARDLFTRVNPYTGLALKDDPAMLPFNIINECPIGMRLPRVPAIQVEYEKIAEAKHPGFSSLPETERERLLGNLAADIQVELHQDLKAFLRSIGIRQPLSDMSMHTRVGMTMIRRHFDYVDDHDYHARYPFYVKVNPTQDLSSPLDKGLYFPLGITTARYIGKPFTYGESNIYYASPYRLQYATLMATFSGLQEWEEVLHYTLAHRVERLDGSSNTFGAERLNFGADPLMLFGDRILTLLRPAPAKYTIPYVVTEKYVRDTMTIRYGPVFPANYSRLGVFAKIGCFLADGDAPELANALFLIVPAKMEIPDYLKKYPLVTDDANWETLLRKAMELGKCPDSIGLQQDKRIISSTGEVTFDSRRYLQVVTPTAESLLPKANTAQMDGDVLHVSQNTRAANFFLGALDKRPLRESRRMLLLYLTDLKNTGAEYGKGNTLVNYGKPPVLVQKGTVQMTLNLPKKPTLWEVDYRGRRLAKVPLEKTDGGWRASIHSYRSPESFYAYEVTMEP
ncbi:MAG: hypothetical protein IJJ26_02925 [Victivallales bacterium]|nr:hypothetical protein [Victivallales bacterium]